MIEVNAEQMKAVYQDLYEMSVQVGKMENELEAVCQILRRITLMEENLHQLNRAKEKMRKNRYQIMQLSIALEKITAAYCRTEMTIEKTLDADDRNYGSFKTSVVNVKELTERIYKLWQEEN